MRTTKIERTAQSRGCEISAAIAAANQRWDLGRKITLARSIELELGRAGFRIVREPKGRTLQRCGACAALTDHAPDCGGSGS